MDQYNIEIFSCFLRLLPLYSSIFHQTNVEIVLHRSKDNPLISRIQSLHLLLEVDDHDEEEYSIPWQLVDSLKRGNFDSVPTRHQPDFKKALSTMYRLKKAEDEKQYAKWSQSSSSWWQWQTNWWESDRENSPQRWGDH